MVAELGAGYRKRSRSSTSAYQRHWVLWLIHPLFQSVQLRSSTVCIVEVFICLTTSTASFSIALWQDLTTELDKVL